MLVALLWARYALRCPYDQRRDLRDVLPGNSGALPGRVLPGGTGLLPGRPERDVPVAAGYGGWQGEAARDYVVRTRRETVSAVPACTVPAQPAGSCTNSPGNRACSVLRTRKWPSAVTIWNPSVPAGTSDRPPDSTKIPAGPASTPRLRTAPASSVTRLSVKRPLKQRQGDDRHPTHRPGEGQDPFGLRKQRRRHQDQRRHRLRGSDRGNEIHGHLQGATGRQGGRDGLGVDRPDPGAAG